MNRQILKGTWMAFTLYTFMGNLAQLGILDILLPFLLFYAIILGLLSKVAPWEQKNLNNIISAVISLFIVAYTPFGMQMGTYLTGLFGGASMYIVGLLVLILLMGMFGINLKGGLKDAGLSEKVAVVILVIIAVGIWYFAGPGGAPGFRLTDSMITILILAGLIGIVWKVGSGGGSDNGGAGAGAGAAGAGGGN